MKNKKALQVEQNPVHFGQDDLINFIAMEKLHKKINKPIFIFGLNEWQAIELYINRGWEVFEKN